MEDICNTDISCGVSIEYVIYGYPMGKPPGLSITILLLYCRTKILPPIL